MAQCEGCWRMLGAQVSDGRGCCACWAYGRCRLSVIPHLMYSRLRGTFLFERIDGVVKVSVAQNRPTYDPIQRHKG